MQEVFNLTCPYCGKNNPATTNKSGFFQLACLSCTCEFGVEVIQPNYSGTYKISNPIQVKKS